ncbi:MAG: NAD-dependent succinate-semialdehyde dehydrogenase [bacterium]|nr:NAD-dependent succinate-semialdehyde dehydrogenase [bacterium]
MKAVNPATEAVLREYAEHTPEEVRRFVDSAEDAFQAWRRTSFSHRADVLHKAAELLRRDTADHAELMTLEMGKAIAESEAEVQKCAWVCDHFADHAESYLQPESIESDAGHSFVRFDPLGPVLAVMPWNFPYWQVFRFAAPTLMAGNVGLLKHASNVPGCALAIERVLREAGAPEGAFATLMISSAAVAPVIQHPAVRAVTLTGSEPAGVAVASQAGAALKKTVLELGGSDPFVVLADADPCVAADAAALARTINAGQSCIAAKRFIVEDTIADTFEQALTERMAALKVGDPLDRANQLGPLARGDLVDELHDQVERSAKAGARITTGGRPLDRKGYYYPPTVLTGVKPGMAAFDEETFGPVAAVIRAKNVDHALELANQSEFGLGASLWTADTEQGTALAAEIQAGAVFVNGIVKSDPRLPFGGIKRSGYGRELAAYGIREFVNVKTVWVK